MDINIDEYFDLIEEEIKKLEIYPIKLNNNKEIIQQPINIKHDTNIEISPLDIVIESDESKGSILQTDKGYNPTESDTIYLIE